MMLFLSHCLLFVVGLLFAVVDVLGSAVAEIPRGFVISLSFCFCCCDERESFELNLCQIGIEKQSRCFE